MTFGWCRGHRRSKPHEVQALCINYAIYEYPLKAVRQAAGLTWRLNHSRLKRVQAFHARHVCWHLIALNDVDSWAVQVD